MFKWWNKYKKSKMGIAGLAVFIIIVLLIILVPVISSHDATTYSKPGFEPPTFSGHAHVFLNITTGLLETVEHGAHILGTNAVGQDLWTQLWLAGRVSLLIGVVASVIVTSIGTTAGLVAGYFGGLVDELLIRLCDMLMVLPRLPMMILMAAFMGPGIPSIIFVICVFGWTAPTRGIRAQVHSIKTRTYVEAARTTGGSKRHIIWNHIFPNVSGIAIAHFVLEIMRVIMLEASLSFLGLGDPKIPSWGNMLNLAQSEGAFTMAAWWWFIPPGLAISLLGASCNFIGTTINDRFILKVRRARG